MRKNLGRLLLVLLLVCLLASPASAAFHESGYPVVDDTVTYTMLNPTSRGEDWANLRLFQVMEELTHVKFAFTNTPSGDYTTRQNLLLASGDLPDVLWTALDSRNVVTYGVEGGALYDISKGIDPYMPHMAAMMADYPISKAAVTEMNGAMYVLPKVSMTATESGETLFVRTDYLKKLGLEKPTTIEGFYDMLVALSQGGFGGNFVPLLPNNMTTLETYLFPSFGDGVDPAFADAGDGITVAYNPISQQMKEYLTFMNKLFAEKLLEPEIYSMDASVITAKIKANECAVMTSGTSFTLANFESGQYEVEMISPMSSSFTDTRKIRGVAYEKVGGVSISSKAKNPEVLLRYFDVWFSQEDVEISGLNGNSTKFGLYGVDWEYLDDAHVYYRRIVPADTTLTEEEWRITNVAPASQPPAYAIMTAVAQGNPAQEMKGIQCLENLIPYWVDRFPGSFLKFTTQENEVIANRMTDIDTYVTMMKAKFITGAEPLTKWDEYVATIERMGIADVLKVYQAAYDRFNVIKSSVK